MVKPVQSVVRAMSVLAAFDRDHPQMTLAEVAQRTELSRGTAHRLLATLEHLGYLRSHDGTYALTYRILGIGSGYLASQPLAKISQHVLASLGAEVDEHCSVGIVDSDTVLVIAASPVQRQIALVTRVGSRLPLDSSATGRALFAEDDADLLNARINALSLSNDAKAVLHAEGTASASRGYSTADQTLESGVTAIGAPIRNPEGQIVASLAIASPSWRYQDTPLASYAADALLRAAAEIQLGLGVTEPVPAPNA